LQQSLAFFSDRSRWLQDYSRKSGSGCIAGRLYKDFVTRHPERSFITQLENNVQIEGDALLLRMAFNNLLENAVKYSQRDTTITISLTRKTTRLSLHLPTRDQASPMMRRKSFL
jgi:signal transduction histidine kinase